MQLLHPISDLHLLSSQQGKAICVCLLQKRLWTICLQQAKKDKLSETHPTFTQIHPREISCRLLTMSTVGRHSLFDSIWILAFYFFLVALAVNRFANVAFGSPLLGCSACPQPLSIRSIFVLLVQPAARLAQIIYGAQPCIPTCDREGRNVNSPASFPLLSPAHVKQMSSVLVLRPKITKVTKHGVLHTLQLLQETRTRWLLPRKFLLSKARTVS